MTPRAILSAPMRIFFIVTAFLGLLAGCRPQSTERPVPETFELDTIAALVAGQYCAAFRRCLPDVRPEHVLHRGVCLDQLTTRIRDQLRPVNEAVDIGRAVYEPTGLRTCLDAMAASSCRDVDIQAFESACAGIVLGLTPLGASCRVDAECANGFCPGEDGCHAVCTRLADVAEPCDIDGDVQCKAGLDCDRDDLCQPKEEIQLRAGLGQLCHVHPCESGLRCVRLPEPACVPFGLVYGQVEGETCRSSTDERPELGCAPGLVCSFPEAASVMGDGVCRSMPQVGDVCHLTIGGSNAWCAPGLFCEGLNPVDGILEGRCRHIPDTGTPCGDFFGSPRICGANERCHDGLCEEKHGSGEPCASDRECRSGRCFEGGCALNCIEMR